MPCFSLLFTPPLVHLAVRRHLSLTWMTREGRCSWGCCWIWWCTTTPPWCLGPCSYCSDTSVRDRKSFWHSNRSPLWDFIVEFKKNMNLKKISLQPSWLCHQNIPHLLKIHIMLLGTLYIIETKISNLRDTKYCYCISPVTYWVGSEARRLLAIMCIGFLANHLLCKHPQNQLVRVYQCLFTTFQILFLCN